MDGEGGWGVSEPSPGPDHLRRLPFFFFLSFCWEIMRTYKAALALRGGWPASGE